MFSEKKEKMMTESISQQNRISEGTTITGDIKSKGDFRVDGAIKGSLEASSKVVVGKKGSIDGKLKCQNADIEGVFSGELYVSGLLNLKETAKIQGEVVVGKLAVDPGAEFNVSCVMKGSERELNKNEKGKKIEISA